MTARGFYPEALARFQPPLSETASPSSPSLPSPARTESGTEAGDSAQLVHRCGGAQGQGVEEDQVLQRQPVLDSAHAPPGSASPSPLGDGQLGDLGGVGHADCAAITEQPVAAGRVGAVHRTRNSADRPAQGLGVVGSVQRSGPPPGLHHHGHGGQRGDQPVPLQEPVPGWRRSRAAPRPAPPPGCRQPAGDPRFLTGRSGPLRRP